MWGKRPIKRMRVLPACESPAPKAPKAINDLTKKLLSSNASRTPKKPVAVDNSSTNQSTQHQSNHAA
jgi:hypothetical protein